MHPILSWFGVTIFFVGKKKFDNRQYFMFMEGRERKISDGKEITEHWILLVTHPKEVHHLQDLFTCLIGMDVDQNFQAYQIIIFLSFREELLLVWSVTWWIQTVGGEIPLRLMFVADPSRLGVQVQAHSFLCKLKNQVS